MPTPIYQGRYKLYRSVNACNATPLHTTSHIRPAHFFTKSQDIRKLFICNESHHLRTGDAHRFTAMWPDRTSHESTAPPSPLSQGEGCISSSTFLFPFTDSWTTTYLSSSLIPRFACCESPPQPTNLHGATPAGATRGTNSAHAPSRPITGELHAMHGQWWLPRTIRCTPWTSCPGGPGEATTRGAIFLQHVGVG